MTSRISFFFLLLILTFGCSKEIDLEQSSDSLVTTENLTYLEHLCQLGVNTENAEFYTDYIVVNDVAFSKEGLTTMVDAHPQENLSEAASSRNNAISNVPYISRSGNILFAIHPSISEDLGSSWPQAIKNALANYERISGSRINFTEVRNPSRNISGINFRSDLDRNLPYCMRNLKAAASAFFPSRGNFHGFISISASATSNHSSCAKETLVRHEVGHTLGLLHTGSNSSPGNCFSQSVSGRLIETTNNPSNSIMSNAAGVRPTDCRQLSSDDIYACTALYPRSYAPGTLRINVTSSSFTNSTLAINYRGSVSTSSAPYKIDIQVRNSSNRLLQTHTYFSRTGSDTKGGVLKNIPPGTYSFQARISNFRGDYVVNSQKVYKTITL